uniref:Uncharacterized protein n=1 Tax=Anguilla anguilla TaxID=7936 RepID=A0A0E9XSJ2_ANGAN
MLSTGFSLLSMVSTITYFCALTPNTSLISFSMFFLSICICPDFSTMTKA